MSVVSEVLRNEETRAGGRRTVVGILNSVDTLESGRLGIRRRFPKRLGGRDPLGDARKRLRMQRRGMHGFELGMNLSKRDRMAQLGDPKLVNA
jgi:hypothetical protein